MYIGRRLRYNKVVPLCAMEGDRVSGGIAPLIFNLALDRCDWSGCLPWPLYCQWKSWSWSWRLGGRWSWSGCSGEERVLLLLPRFEPQIIQHISWSFYWLCCLILIEDNTKVCINKMIWEFWIGWVWFMTGISGRLLWTWLFPLKFWEGEFLLMSHI